jgi:hypothetical protein
MIKIPLSFRVQESNFVYYVLWFVFAAVLEKTRFFGIHASGCKEKGLRQGDGFLMKIVMIPQ